MSYRALSMLELNKDVTSGVRNVIQEHNKLAKLCVLVVQ